MPEPVFVIRNQQGLYLTRQNEWVDGHDPAPLFKTPFRDAALNTLIELNAKDIELRGVLAEVEVNEKGLPQVMPGEINADDSAPAVDPAPVFELVPGAELALVAEPAPMNNDAAATDSDATHVASTDEETRPGTEAEPEPEK